MKTGLALFDFDGTITSRDTLFEIIKFSKGTAAFFAGMMVLSPVMALHRVGLVSAAKAKETVLRFFFAGMPAAAFESICVEFCRSQLPTIIRQGAIPKINEHLALGNRVIVVSASAQDWIVPWCSTLNIECVATRLQVSNNCITGRLASPNCNGSEKVRRIKELLTPSDYSPVYAYGDTAGDKPMLALADVTFYKPFRDS